MYASVGDEVENAEQIESGKSLKVQVSWSALLSSVGVGGKVENFTSSPEFVNHRMFLFRHYRFINSIKERLHAEYALM